MVYSVNRAGLRQAITLPQMRGRVTTAGRVFGFVAVVLGSLLGGLLGQRIGLAATIVIAACGSFPAFLWLLWSPVRTLQEIPV